MYFGDSTRDTHTIGLAAPQPGGSGKRRRQKNPHSRSFWHVQCASAIFQLSMISRFITEIKASFNPFSPRAKSVRLLLANIPPNARQNGMNITTQLLPRTTSEPDALLVKFSTLALTYIPPSSHSVAPSWADNLSNRFLRAFRGREGDEAGLRHGYQGRDRRD